MTADHLEPVAGRATLPPLGRASSRARSRRIVVLGTAASNPWAGLAWMHMQIMLGLLRLGHDAYYVETTSAWPYDPIRRAAVGDSDYALPYLSQLAKDFGIADRWAYRRSYSDGQWFGLPGADAEALLAGADAVLNVAGATRLAWDGLEVGRLVYLGTDPGYRELALAKGDEDVRAMVEEHDDCVTYGENIGTADCPIPPLPRLRSKTRQPILLDLWVAGPPSRSEFTTVSNWRDGAWDIEYGGTTYYWSKRREFLKFIDLPRRAGRPIELATGFSGLNAEDRESLISNPWRLRDAHSLTTDPWRYRDYVRSSPGEFTVTKDQYARLRSGWFSERSACYLAAGRPVVCQDTGFGNVLPTGEGLFACATTDEAVAALEAIDADYERHSRAARSIAEEFFAAETVLARLLDDLGL